MTYTVASGTLNPRIPYHASVHKDTRVTLFYSVSVVV